MTGQADKPPRRVRIATLVLVALIHVGIGIGVVRMFTPDLPAAIIKSVFEAYQVVVFTPRPEVKVKPGPAAPEGRNADPRAVSAPRVELPLHPQPAPPASGAGQENAAGAAAQGTGTGAGGDGRGTGGGRGARQLEKIAGEINSAKDYRKKTRDLRIGQSVTILLSVGNDGRVTGCKVTMPSPDAEADVTTCRLASERFRFRPATDRNGNPVAGQYAWRQRWFYDQPAKAE